ncbi:M20/M25/M40 family metallo-hydrolase [Dokdonella immobilis]|uniref:Acetylornithine deacetylase/Succinyl-diaminopimelate desuccinylase n=1 Tax=Dokdonella immobilis TaxID=578942 RepID=A0A1I4X3A7_9GAMM|nr:M20/M25/M40 family metallo-hydrolase [Dokdonella immobilis]SFN19906.1 Acetylornithine deacetylase/Succinyl-diaminopimelate desuccinylase [Dokdonella immobilis]
MNEPNACRVLRTHVVRIVLLGACALACVSGWAGDAGREPQLAMGRTLLAELIGTDTTPNHGSTTAAAEKLARRFRDAGFAADDVMLLGDTPLKRNLVVRLRGQGKRAPILLLAHLDVVEARREDWHFDPFALTERAGWFYGRGTMDIKGAAVGLASALLRLQAEGITPRGDYVLALTAGEEDGVANGVEWLLAHRPDLMRASFAINVDGGGPEIRGGKPAQVSVETAEKVYLSYTVTARNPGGHSSLPTPDNAIYRLAHALVRLSAHEFPLRTNAATRGYFGGLAESTAGPLGDDMRAIANAMPDAAALARVAASSTYNNAQLRTTCVPTLLQGGHAENALPQMARAMLNCRLLPDEDADTVDQVLRQAIADPDIELARVAEPHPSPPTAVDAGLFERIAEAGEPLWGRLPVRPYMSAGATDSVFLRATGMPVFVFNGIPYDVDDDRSHGQDERIRVDSFDQSLEFTYRLLKTL